MMALFGETRGPEGALPAGPSAPNQINMIGEGTVFDGTLRTKGDVRVSGRMVGTLEVEGRVIVAQEGIIEGEVETANADIAGNVQGDLEIKDRLILRSTAHVEGKIRTGRLIVEEGAVFDGTCQMGASGAVHTSDGPREAKLPRHPDPTREHQAPRPKVQVVPSTVATGGERAAAGAQ